MKDNTQEKTVSFFGKTIPESESCFSEGWTARDAELKSKNMQERYENEGGKKLTNYAIFTAFRDIQKFNKIMGTFEGNLAEKLDLYNSLSFEELCESIEAVETNNTVEVLDGVLDEFVIIVGKMLILEEAGFNIAEGLKRINKNNMSKLIPVGEAVHYNPEFTKVLNEEYQVYVLKDVDGKTRKPSNFKSVDLSDLVPEGFFEGGIV